MPGLPEGIPGTASPTMFAGFSVTTFLTRSAGTCPSNTYRPETPVWHDRSAAGTPSVSLVSDRSSRSWVVGVNPFFLRFSTQALQQPQVGVLYTVIGMPAGAALPSF